MELSKLGCRAIGNDQKPNGSSSSDELSTSSTTSAHPAYHERGASPVPSERKAELHPFSAPTPAFLAQVRTAEMLREAILRHVRYTLVRPLSELQPVDYLKPVSLAIRDRIVDRMLETEARFRHRDAKRLYYLSMEFLMGRSLGDNLSNLRI